MEPATGQCNWLPAPATDSNGFITSATLVRWFFHRAGIPQSALAGLVPRARRHTQTFSCSRRGDSSSVKCRLLATDFSPASWGHSLSPIRRNGTFQWPGLPSFRRTEWRLHHAPSARTGCRLVASSALWA